MPVTPDPAGSGVNASSGASRILGTTSFEFPHTCSGQDRLLVVPIAWALVTVAGAGAYLAGLTYNGIPLSFYASDSGDELWYLINPPAGTYDISVQAGGDVLDEIAFVAGGVSWNGVRSWDPLVEFTNNSDITAAPFVDSFPAFSPDSYYIDVLRVVDGASPFTVATLDNQSGSPSAGGPQISRQRQRRVAGATIYQNAAGDTVYVQGAAGILDDFNRANGNAADGTHPWIPKTAGDPTIASNQASLAVDNDVVWDQVFGADQEVRMKAGNTSWPTQFIVYLKLQSTAIGSDHIEVHYNNGLSQIECETRASGAWTSRGVISSVTLASGDELAARARADGFCEIYKNGVLLATFDCTALATATSPGRIGFGWWGNTAFRADDFGGGTSTLGVTGTGVMAPRIAARNPAPRMWVQSGVARSTRQVQQWNNRTLGSTIVRGACSIQPSRYPNQLTFNWKLDQSIAWTLVAAEIMPAEPWPDGERQIEGVLRRMNPRRFQRPRVLSRSTSSAEDPPVVVEEPTPDTSRIRARRAPRPVTRVKSHGEEASDDTPGTVLPDLPRPRGRKRKPVAITSVDHPDDGDAEAVRDFRPPVRRPRRPVVTVTAELETPDQVIDPELTGRRRRKATLPRTVIASHEHDAPDLAPGPMADSRPARRRVGPARSPRVIVGDLPDETIDPVVDAAIARRRAPVRRRPVVDAQATEALDETVGPVPDSPPRRRPRPARPRVIDTDAPEAPDQTVAVTPDTPIMRRPPAPRRTRVIAETDATDAPDETVAATPEKPVIGRPRVAQRTRVLAETDATDAPDETVGPQVDVVVQRPPRAAPRKRVLADVDATDAPDEEPTASQGQVIAGRRPPRARPVIRTDHQLDAPDEVPASSQGQVVAGQRPPRARPAAIRTDHQLDAPDETAGPEVTTPVRAKRPSRPRTITASSHEPDAPDQTVGPVAEVARARRRAPAAPRIASGETPDETIDPASEASIVGRRPSQRRARVLVDAQATDAPDETVGATSEMPVPRRRRPPANPRVIAEVDATDAPDETVGPGADVRTSARRARRPARIVSDVDAPDTPDENPGSSQGLVVAGRRPPRAKPQVRSDLQLDAPDEVPGAGADVRARRRAPRPRVVQSTEVTPDETVDPIADVGARRRPPPRPRVVVATEGAPEEIIVEPTPLADAHQVARRRPRMALPMIRTGEEAELEFPLAASATVARAPRRPARPRLIWTFDPEAPDLTPGPAVGAVVPARRLVVPRATTRIVFRPDSTFEEPEQPIQLQEMSEWVRVPRRRARAVVRILSGEIEEETLQQIPDQAMAAVVRGMARRIQEIYRRRAAGIVEGIIQDRVLGEAREVLVMMGASVELLRDLDAAIVVAVGGVASIEAGHREVVVLKSDTGGARAIEVVLTVGESVSIGVGASTTLARDADKEVSIAVGGSAEVEAADRAAQIAVGHSATVRFDR